MATPSQKNRLFSRVSGIVARLCRFPQWIIPFEALIIVTFVAAFLIPIHLIVGPRVRDKERIDEIMAQIEENTERLEFERHMKYRQQPKDSLARQP